MIIDKLCRSCINCLTDDELKHTDDSAIKMYAYCTKIKIKDSKEMPKYFCTKCSIQIKSSFKFIRKAQSVNDTYKNFIIKYKEKYPGHDNIELGTHIVKLENEMVSFIKNLESYHQVDSAIKILDEMAWNDNIEDMPCYTEELKKMFKFISTLLVESKNDSQKQGMNGNAQTQTEIVTSNCITSTEQMNTANSDPNQSNFVLLPNFTDVEVNAAIDNLEDTQDIDLNVSQDIDMNDTEDSDINLEVSPVCDKDNSQRITSSCPLSENSYLDNEESCIVDNLLECDKNQLKTVENNHKNKTKSSATKHEPIPCTFCPKIFNSKTWFNKHIEREHINNIFKCDKCDKVYMSYGSWREHKKVHKTCNVKDKICNVCHKRFRKKNHLEEHMVCHSDERPFACHLCDKKFKLKMVLIRHLAIHDNVKTKICHYCGRAFRDDRALNDHMVRHTGSKPFSCDECDFRAQYRATLKRHKLRHSMVRAHACQHCPKSFFTSDDLQRHSRIHTGEKPYQCPYCPRSFAEHCKRKAHLVSQHHLLFEEIPRLNRDGSIYKE